MAQFRLSELIMKFGVLSGKPMPETPPEIMEEGTPERYLFWMKRAAEGGLPIAQLELARFHTIKWPREAAHLANEVEGLKWLERAATQSTDGRSRYNAAAILGGFYFRGDIVPQDYQRALRWFNVVVDEKRGEFWGCGSLGGAVRSYLIRMYQERLGVEKDPTKVEYYSRTPRNVCI